MRAGCGWGAAVIAAMAVSACATNRDAKAGAAAPTPAIGGSGGAQSSRYVDDALGFEVSRPGPEWQLDVTGDEGTEGIATPVVLRHPQMGAQVIIQVAPAVASPGEFAERLAQGMRGHPGFVTSDPEPLPLSDDAVGFRFSMGDRVHGRVAVRAGAQGRVLMLLGTWPAEASTAVPAAVDEVFRGVKPIRAVTSAATEMGCGRQLVHVAALSPFLPPCGNESVVPLPRLNPQPSAPRGAG
jgi:hypothetical protein